MVAFGPVVGTGVFSSAEAGVAAVVERRPCSKTRWASQALVPVVTRFRADATRIKLCLGKARNSGRDVTFGTKLAEWLRRFEEWRMATKYRINWAKKLDHPVTSETKCERANMQLCIKAWQGTRCMCVCISELTKIVSISSNYLKNHQSTCIQLFQERLSEKSTKVHATRPKGGLGIH